MLEVCLIGILLGISLVDIAKREIPDRILWIAIVLRMGLLFSENGSEVGTSSIEVLRVLMDGALVSLPLLLLVTQLEKRLHYELMGGGDIKLLFVTGMYVGWEKNLFGLLVAAIIGLVVALCQKRNFIKRNATIWWRCEMPFGPAIAIGTVVSMFLYPFFA